jgi:hypothetical protein
MNNVVLREFKLYFRNEDEALARASEYMSSGFRKSADGRSVLVGGVIGGVASATGYVVEYVLGLPSESHVGRTATISGLMVAILLLPKRQADAARRYLETTLNRKRWTAGETGPTNC